SHMYPKLLLELFQYQVGAFDIACSAKAHIDAESSLRLEIKLGIERHDSVNLRQRNAQPFSYLFLNAQRQISVQFLGFMEYRYQCPRCILVFVDDFLQLAFLLVDASAAAVV